MTAKVEVGKELSFSTDMNETVLERFAHLERKLKAAEEENKSLRRTSLCAADSRFESPTLEASRDFGVHLIEGNDEKTRFYTGVPAIGVFLALTKYLKKKAI